MTKCWRLQLRLSFNPKLPLPFVPHACIKAATHRMRSPLSAALHHNLSAINGINLREYFDICERGDENDILLSPGPFSVFPSRVS